MRIVLTDGDERATLAAARSLRARGHGVWVTAPGRVSLAGSAHGISGVRVALDPLAHAGEYAESIARLTERIRADVLLPVTDASVEAVLEHRCAFAPSVAIPLPSHATYRAVSNKAGILPSAERAGFAVPETVRLDARDAPMDDAARLLPGFAKPHRSVVARPDGRRWKLPVVRVNDAGELARCVGTLPDEAFPVLVQRAVHGPGEGLFLLRWNGEIVAAFAHRRLREKPPVGGVSVYRESIPLAPDLYDAGTRLLAEHDWHGVAMVECKREIATNRPVLMEVNGRLWGSLQLAIDAGVDFPALLVQCATGVPPSRHGGYRAGVRSRWFWGDVDHLYLALRHGPANGETRWSSVAEFLRVAPGREREEVFRVTDPAPFLVETLRWFALERLWRTRLFS